MPLYQGPNNGPAPVGSHTAIAYRFIARRPIPFPSIGDAPIPETKQTPIYREELKNFTSIFREMHEKYAQFRGRLKKQLEEVFMWDQEVRFTPKADDRPTGKFVAAKKSANATITNMTELSHQARAPYFGRIDFKFSSEAPSRFRNQHHTFYIGKRGVQLKSYKISDWRAPISSIYYNFPTPAPDCFYKSPKGMMTGELLLKHKIDIENATLINVYDSTDMSALVGSDPFLMRQLQKGSSTKLKDIISTIQTEQNTIISMEPDTDIVVAGVAGSGKTSIAVHRLSWLLYNYHDMLPHRCLIIGPSKLFLHYIADILPETGSENVPQMTFQDWAFARLRGIVLPDDIDTSVPPTSVKTTAAYLKRLDDYAEKLRRQRIKVTSSNLDSFYRKHTGAKHLTADDLAPLVYFKAVATGVLPSERHHYVVVDEAQDHTPAELGALKKYTDKGRFMVVGDIMQGILNQHGISDWDSLYDGILDEKESAKFTIKTSYRSTKQIISYVNRTLIPQGIPSSILPLAVLREGPEPVVHSGLSLEDILAEIPNLVTREQGSGLKNIAIIVPARHSSLFFQELSQKIPKLITITSGNDRYDGGVLVSSIDLLKGLEFDSVIFVNTPEGDDLKLEQKKFYTSCTRAMHRLYVLGT